MYEVELKFRLPDPGQVLQRFAEWGAQAAAPVDQSDTYFRHPGRDFAATHEALRIRRTGNENCLTYKGPVIDLRTKTRREIEVPIASGSDAARQFAEILEVLGFQPVRTVQKRRCAWHLAQGDREFELALDEVAGLGNFLEIETLADEAERATAADAILGLAADLGLSEPERRSYLSLLLEADGKKT